MIEQPTSCSNPAFPMMKYYTMVQQCNPGPNEYSQVFVHTQAIGGQMPQAGQYFYMSALHDYSNPPSNYAWNGNWVAYEVISVSGPAGCDSPTNINQNLCEISGCNASLPPPFYNNSPYDACTPPSSGCPCSLQDFQNAAGPSLTNYPNLMNNWIPIFHGKYMIAANCCNFLQKRLTIQMNKLQTQLSPNHQAQVQTKIMAINAILKACCPPIG